VREIDRARTYPGSGSAAAATAAEGDAFLTSGDEQLIWGC